MNLGLSLKSFAVHKQRFKLINELEAKSIIFNMADLLLCEDVHRHFLSLKEFEFESGFYVLSASKAIFRARTHNCITYSVR